MPYYKLVASGRRPDLRAEEIILSRDDDSGEPKHTLSTREINEIPDELLGDARNHAYRLGFDVVEHDPPEDLENSEEENSESNEEGQEPAADTAGQAPAVSPTGESGAAIDQQKTAQQGARASQQGAPNADAGTTQSGVSGASATTQGGTSASAATSSTPPPSNS